MYIYKTDSLHIDYLVHTPLKDAEGGRESISLKTWFLCTTLLADVYIQAHIFMPDAQGETIDLRNNLFRTEPYSLPCFGGCCPSTD